MINIIVYYDIVTTVEPKRIALREANEQLEAANNKLASVRTLTTLTPLTTNPLPTSSYIYLSSFTVPLPSTPSLRPSFRACSQPLHTPLLSLRSTPSSPS